MISRTWLCLGMSVLFSVACGPFQGEVRFEGERRASLATAARSGAAEGDHLGSLLVSCVEGPIDGSDGRSWELRRLLCDARWAKDALAWQAGAFGADRIAELSCGAAPGSWGERTHECRGELYRTSGSVPGGTAPWTAQPFLLGSTQVTFQSTGVVAQETPPGSVREVPHGTGALKSLGKLRAVASVEAPAEALLEGMRLAASRFGASVMAEGTCLEHAGRGPICQAELFAPGDH